MKHVGCASGDIWTRSLVTQTHSLPSMQPCHLESKEKVLHRTLALVYFSSFCVLLNWAKQTEKWTSHYVGGAENSHPVSREFTEGSLGGKLGMSHSCAGSSDPGRKSAQLPAPGNTGKGKQAPPERLSPQWCLSHKRSTASYWVISFRSYLRHNLGCLRMINYFKVVFSFGEISPQSLFLLRAILRVLKFCFYHMTVWKINMTWRTYSFRNLKNLFIQNLLSKVLQRRISTWEK